MRVAVLLLLAAAALLPLTLPSNAALNFAFLALLFAFLGQGWNILGGYGGQFSFGHAAFFGVGAYTTAILQLRYGFNAWATVPLAIACGAGLGLFIGTVSFRYGLRGSYFALVTLAFAEILRILASTLPITGGGAGLLIPLDVGAANLQFAARSAFYWLMLGCVAFAFLVTLGIERSRFGLQLAAVREDEGSAAALGVPVFATKLKAITLSGALMALGGVVYAQYFLYLDPGIAFGPRISVEALLVPMVGGIGTAAGPILGSFLVHGLGEATRALAGELPGVNLIVYGLLLLAVLRFAPDGVVGAMRRLGGWRRVTAPA